MWRVVLALLVAVALSGFIAWLFVVCGKPWGAPFGRLDPPSCSFLGLDARQLVWATGIAAAAAYGYAMWWAWSPSRLTRR